LRTGANNWASAPVITRVDANAGNVDLLAANGFGSILAFNPNPASGDKLGMRVYGAGPVHIEVWLYTGGAWYRVGAATDSDVANAITSAGYSGAHVIINSAAGTNNTQFDDFGGGTITAPTYTINSDGNPGFQDGRRDRIADQALQRGYTGPAQARADKIGKFGMVWQPTVAQLGAQAYGGGVTIY